MPRLNLSDFPEKSFFPFYVTVFRKIKISQKSCRFKSILCPKLRKAFSLALDIFAIITFNLVLGNRPVNNQH